MTSVHKLASTPSRRTSCFSGLAVPGSDSGRTSPEISQTRISMTTIHRTAPPCGRYWRTRRAFRGCTGTAMWPWSCLGRHGHADPPGAGETGEASRSSPNVHRGVSLTFTSVSSPATLRIPSGWAARPRPLRTRPRLGLPGQIQHIPKMMKENPVMVIHLRSSSRLIQDVESWNHQRSMHLMPSRSQAADRRRWATFSLTAKT